jgi:DNA-binding protein HU-beta
VNKSELVDALAARFEGNRKAAQHALEAVLDTITREVARGEKVAITGFGLFEKRVREARWIRNPQTGAGIKAKKTVVPKFTAGADLKNVVSGARKHPRLTPADGAAASREVAPTQKTGAAKRATTKKATAAKKAPAKKATKRATAKKATAAKKAPAKKATKKTAAKKATKKTAAKKATKKTAAKKASAAKTPAAASTRPPGPATLPPRPKPPVSRHQ